ncbi:MAG: anthranilate synthase component I [Dehalococcoidaceae bacterium]|nr:anthranilate synthase component I [Dehalococcoidaceae bacterium]
MYHPGIDELNNMRGKGTRVAVYREILADMETPVSAYLKINRGCPSFLLESVTGGERIGRYSFIGTEPSDIIGPDSQTQSDPLELAFRKLDTQGYIKLPGLPRFCGGAVGYLSYEMAGRFEKLSFPDADPVNIPEFLLMFANEVLVFDHVAHTIKILSHISLEGDIETSYFEATGRIEELVRRLQGPVPASNPAKHVAESRSSPVSNFSRPDFEAGVDRLRQYIASGEAIQVVLSQRFTSETSAPPFDIYRSLRSINPSPYMFFLDFVDFQLIGASPEILVGVEGENITTRPLAGTRRRGKTASEDDMLEKELTSDEKERAEHIMLVDLGRNDIGRVSQPGSVIVSELMEVERYSHVMHLVTNVTGKLQPGVGAVNGLKACFPAGTVTGAPKIRAMQLISEIEPEKRGAYAGAVGYFSYCGNMDMAIAIRTIVYKQNIVYVQAGAGIVHDSRPEKEYEETLNKAGVLLEAVKQAEQKSGGGKAHDSDYR